VIPFEVVASLQSPANPASGPILLDGILCAGLGGRLGSQEPGKWAGPEKVTAAVEAGALPLGRIEAVGTWWYAASQATPQGREEVRHLHKRLPQTFYERYTSTKNINIATGPDKSLRLPYYLRPDWLTLRWFCVGDPVEVAALLWRVGGVGKVTTHGNGWVRQWRLSTGQVVEPLRWRGQEAGWEVQAPALPAYATDLKLRHLPVSKQPALPVGSRVQRRWLPLRPPYHTGFDPDASRNQLCWQVLA
jgi:hypothetical protein